MIYIVLREPTSSGFVNRMAFSDNDAVEVISCGGSTIATQKGRLSEIGELANEVNISQAQGAVAQGVEGSLAVVDWDGAARVSAEIYAGTKRFYGWSLAVARSDSPTTTPDWLWGDPDHCMVTDISTDGGTIGLTYGERWANDGRLLAFGKDRATVPLVVGGHDVWVKTIDLDARNRVAYDRCDPSINQGNPWDAVQFTYESYTASSKRPSETDPSLRVFSFQCINEEDAQKLWAKITQPASPSPAIGMFLCGKIYNYSVNRIEKSDGYKRIDIYCDQNFYDNESPEDVEIVLTAISAPVCAGGSSLVAFFSGEDLATPFGTINVADGILSFSPKNKTKDGFVCYTIVPFTMAWTDSQVPSGANCRSYIDYQGTNVNQIITDGGPVPDYTDVSDYSSIPIGPVRNFFARSTTNTRQYFYLPLVAVISEDVSKKYTRFVSDADATIRVSNTGNASYAWISNNCFPFSKDTHGTPAIALGSMYRENVYRSGPGDHSAALSFSSADELNGKTSSGAFGLKIAASGNTYGEVSFYCEIRAVTIYGVSVIAFGNTSALVKPGPSPIDGSYATTSGLWQAAAAILAQTPHSTYLTPFLPSFVPAPADSGECMDASKTYVENAETLAKETWAIFGRLDGGYISPGYDNQSAQGLGEIPQPPTLQIGRFEDVITEPVVEYCAVAGTLTKKAYIANVDQEYDATNSGKFFGGWGHEPLPETIQSDLLYYRWDVCPIRLGPMPASPDGTYGSWYYETLHGNTIWQSAKDYGYLLWQRCRAAWKVHHIKRGTTFQFRGIYDDSVIGAMWWDAQRNGARRIDWLCLQPRYLTFSVREAKPLCWAGASVYIPGTLAAFAGYDVSDWDQGGGDTLICVKKSYSLTTGKATYTVAIPPVATTSDIPIYRDTLDATHAIDRLVDTLDAAAMISKYTDTLEG